MPQNKTYYKGFSSFQYQTSKTFRLTDIELVKMDLLNHIFTRRGERVMMPTFGTSIPDLVFEPLDETTISDVEDEMEIVFDYDPRVELLDMVIRPEYDRNALTVNVQLRYIELDIVDAFNLNIQFEGQA